MPERLMELREARRQGRVRAITSVCSAHPLVLRAALDHAVARQVPLLVEASCGQVNHLGGQAAMTPEAFRTLVHGLAAEAGLPASGIILGGDRLGPGPWRHEPAAAALAKAGATVEAYVEAGFRKLHLDASLPCAGDGPQLSEAAAAGRVAALCARAERAFRDHAVGHPPVYVVGLDAPAREAGPSGEPHARASTSMEVHRILDLHQEAFAREGVPQAWDRVVALAAQSGADFSETAVQPYDRKRAQPLVKAIAGRRPWMLEARATDYQQPGALRELVEDGVGILKVGPWLTFACREALFALEDMVRELRWADPSWPVVELRVVLDDALRRNPAQWKDRRRATAGEPASNRLFSLRDRSRHCWSDPGVEAEVDRLLAATAGPLPRQILGLHAPAALDAVMDGILEPSGRAIVLHAVRCVLDRYAGACLAPD